MNLVKDFKNYPKILITGSHGFVGKHLTNSILKFTSKNNKIIAPSSKECELKNFQNCLNLTKNADIVIHLAGKVGGIGFNLKNPATLFYDNLIMGVNLIESARINNVKKFVCLGTICAYPKFTPVPFQEENLWSGYPEETNASYGIAKKSLLVMLQSYRTQYKFNGIYLLPVNMYGPYDNFNPSSSHVIPALIKKIHQAKINNEKQITAWGDGSATREFLYVKDACEAIILAALNYNSSNPINIGSGFEISIRELVKKISLSIGYKGKIIWDKSKPNGQPKRRLDVSKAEKEFGFKAHTDFDNGLNETIKWYIDNYKQ